MSTGTASACVMWLIAPEFCLLKTVKIIYITMERVLLSHDILPIAACNHMHFWVLLMAPRARASFSLFKYKAPDFGCSTALRLPNQLSHKDMLSLYKTARLTAETEQEGYLYSVPTKN